MAENRPLGYWLRLVDSLLDRQFETIVEEHGVTRRQWQILNVLTEGPATEARLNEALAPFLRDDAVASKIAVPEAGDGTEEPESVLEHLEELTESGWVIAENGTFTLTYLGQTSLETLTEVVERNREVVTEGISGDEYAATLGVLERMARNLGWTG